MFYFKNFIFMEKEEKYNMDTPSYQELRISDKVFHCILDTVEYRIYPQRRSRSDCADTQADLGHLQKRLLQWIM